MHIFHNFLAKFITFVPSYRNSNELVKASGYLGTYFWKDRISYKLHRCKRFTKVTLQPDVSAQNVFFFFKSKTQGNIFCVNGLYNIESLFIYKTIIVFFRNSLEIYPSRRSMTGKILCSCSEIKNDAPQNWGSRCGGRPTTLTKSEDKLSTHEKFAFGEGANYHCQV